MSFEKLVLSSLQKMKPHILAILGVKIGYESWVYTNMQ